MSDKDDNGRSISEPEGDESVFSDLLDRISESESERELSESTTDSEEQTRTEHTVDTEEPIEQVRELFAERFDQLESVPASDPDGDTLSDKTKWVVFGLICLVIIIGSVTLVGPQMMTELDVDTLEFGRSDEVSADGAPEAFVLPVEEARYLNRLFRESTHEIAYCGQLTTGENLPVVTVWKADTVQSDAEQIKFKTGNCPDGSPEVLLHTHPSGTLTLSDRDKRTLTNHSAQFMCVQGGQTPTQSGRQLTNIACYHQQSSDTDKITFSRVTVVLTDTTEEIDR